MYNGSSHLQGGKDDFPYLAPGRSIPAGQGFGAYLDAAIHVPEPCDGIPLNDTCLVITQNAQRMNPDFIYPAVFPSHDEGAAAGDIVKIIPP